MCHFGETLTCECHCVSCLPNAPNALRYPLGLQRGDRLSLVSVFALDRLRPTLLRHLGRP